MTGYAYIFCIIFLATGIRWMMTSLYFRSLRDVFYLHILLVALLLCFQRQNINENNNDNGNDDSKDDGDGNVNDSDVFNDKNDIHHYCIKKILLVVSK